MTDGRTWLPGPLAPPRASQPAEHVWSIRKEGRQLDCQLRGNGEHGWELQLLRNGEWFYGRRYPTRGLAQAEADAIRARYIGEGGELTS
jgi:hypothetical protein